MNIKFLFVAITCLNVFVSPKLLQVFHIFRHLLHGARGPVYISYDGGKQPETQQELLPSGMRQCYNLGVQLREEYINGLNFLRSEFNHTEIYIRSTELNRTVMSAQALFMGFFPDGPKIPENLEEKYLLPPFKGAKNYDRGLFAVPPNYQSVPIRSTPLQFDELLITPCEQEYILRDMDLPNISPLMDALEVSQKEFIQEICGLFNESICDSVYTLNALEDTYMSDIYQDRFVPNMTEKQFMHFLLISAFNFYATFGGDNYVKYKSYPLFHDILSTFKDKMNDRESALKWIAYSAHDTNIILLASVLNISNYRCLFQSINQGELIENCKVQPSFTSSILFELHESIEGQFYIQVKYDGVYQNICGSIECSFEDFESRIKASIATKEDYKKICKTQEPSTKVELVQIVEVRENVSQLYFLLSIVATIILTIALITKRKRVHSQGNMSIISKESLLV